jgi:gliding motility-associated-like protein
MKPINKIFLIFFCTFFTYQSSFGQCQQYNFPIDLFELPCGSNCINTTVKAPEFRSSNNYKVTSISYISVENIDNSFTQLTNLVSNDNIFSTVIPSPFEINFFNKNYKSFVIGNNGVISFDTLNKNCTNSPLNVIANSPQIIPNNVGQNCGSVNQLNFSKASIFLFQPLSPTKNNNSKIGYKFTGIYPCRKLKVVFENIPLAGVSCNNNLVSFQIDINENTGIINVFIKNKPLCNTTNNNGSILGIQNETRDIGIALANKNNTLWNEKETAYSFIPNGNQTLIKSTILEKNSIQVGTGVINNNQINYSKYCFTAPWDTIYAKIDYKNINGNGTFFIRDTIFLEKSTKPLQCNVSSVPSTCGASNGSIKVTLPIYADTVQYTYSLNGAAYGTSNVFNNLLSGNYYVSVKSYSGTCFFTQNIYINDINPLEVTATTTNAYCNVSDNGTITATAINGTAPYQYAFDTLPFSNNNIYSNAKAGLHSVKVKDVIGCTKTIQVYVGENDPFAFNVTVTNVSCALQNDGSITVNLLSGSGLFTYSINGFTFQSSNVFSNLTAGYYSVFVKDIFGCISTKNTLIITSNSLILTLTKTNASCSSSNDGSITATASAGTPPYLYALNNLTYGTSNVFNNLTVGNYDVYVKDAKGCIMLDNDDVSFTGYTFNYTKVDQGCLSLGSITVTNVNSTALPFTYSINGSIFGSSNFFDSLFSGVYTIVVKDANGCTSLKYVTIGLAEKIEASFTIVSPTCKGASNGSLTITPNGNYLYQLNGSPLQSSNVFNDLIGGSYVLFIKDSLCYKPYQITIPDGIEIDFDATVINNSCFLLPNGSITINPTSGTAPFYYYSNLNLLPNNFFNNINGNTYNIKIEDSIGCYKVKSITVANEFINDFTTSVIGASCSTANNGSITVNTINVGSFQYVINNGLPQTSNVFNQLSAGFYSIKVLDQNNCPITKTVYVYNKNDLTASIQVLENITCINNTAKLQINALNGNGILKYKQFPSTTFQFSNQFSNLTPGFYSYQVVDSFNCSTIISKNITVPVLPKLIVTENRNACNGLNNGLIKFSTNNGLVPFSYSINGSAYTSNDYFYVGAGIYIIKVKDANDCYDSLAVRVLQNTPIDIALHLEQHSGCDASNYSVVKVKASGGSGNFSYSIDNVMYNNIDSFTLPAGSHVIYVRDFFGCVNFKSIIIGLNNSLQLKTISDTTICEGQSVVLETTSNATNYLWSPNYNISTTTTISPVVNPVITTTYLISAKRGICLIEDTVKIVVNKAPIPNAGLDTTICNEQNIFLNGSGGLQYSWKPSNLLNNATIYNPKTNILTTTIFTLSIVNSLGCKSLIEDTVVITKRLPFVVNIGADTTIYYNTNAFLNVVGGVSYNWQPSIFFTNSTSAFNVVKLLKSQLFKVEVLDSNGCKGFDEKLVIVYEPMFVPTIFTPNNDGVNDYFKILGANFASQFTLKIYNRYGQTVFESNSSNKYWDGNYNGQQLEIGTYVFNMFYEDAITKEKISKKGTIILAR